MIIDGKAIAQKHYEKLKERIEKLHKKPKLSAILVGDNEVSLRYIEQKRKWAKHVGIDFELIQMESSTDERKLLSKIKELNTDEKTNGIIVQLPLPTWINTNRVLRTISYKKDVDGFNPVNVGKVTVGDKTAFVPCTPAGIIKILEKEKIHVEGKNITIIGRSNIVGKPLAALLINAWATVTVCNSKTPHIEKHTAMSDIVISAAGCPGILKVNMIKVGTTVIDVWFTVKNGEILGDADFKNIEMVGNTITPVPGWVGPLTVAMLMENTLKAYLNQNKR